MLQRAFSRFLCRCSVFQLPRAPQPSRPPLEGGRCKLRTQEAEAGLTAASRGVRTALETPGLLPFPLRAAGAGAEQTRLLGRLSHSSSGASLPARIGVTVTSHQSQHTAQAPYLTQDPPSLLLPVSLGTNLHVGLRAAALLPPTAG